MTFARCPVCRETRALVRKHRPGPPGLVLPVLLIRTHSDGPGRCAGSRTVLPATAERTPAA